LLAGNVLESYSFEGLREVLAFSYFFREIYLLMQETSLALGIRVDLVCVQYSEADRSVLFDFDLDRADLHREVRLCLPQHSFFDGSVDVLEVFSSDFVGACTLFVYTVNALSGEGTKNRLSSLLSPDNLKALESNILKNNGGEVQ